MDTKRELGGLG